ncbi:MAG: hypothetical protein IPJ47_21870 [Anaerolineales bacterium]|nr:hypothetical protein [Anaerolineales bacterium]
MLNADGKRIGFVTSCAIDSARFITGQAYVQLAYAKEGTVIGVNQGGNVDRPAGLAKVVGGVFPFGYFDMFIIAIFSIFSHYYFICCFVFYFDFSPLN